MKELDVLLERFMERQWAALDSEARTAFEQFLELPDPLLAHYLLVDAPPPDPQPRFLDLARRIRG